MGGGPRISPWPAGCLNQQHWWWMGQLDSQDRCMPGVGASAFHLCVPCLTAQSTQIPPALQQWCPIRSYVAFLSLTAPWWVGQGYLISHPPPSLLFSVQCRKQLFVTLKFVSIVQILVPAPGETVAAQCRQQCNEVPCVKNGYKSTQWWARQPACPQLVSLCVAHAYLVTYMAAGAQQDVHTGKHTAARQPIRLLCADTG